MGPLEIHNRKEAVWNSLMLGVSVAISAYFFFREGQEVGRIEHHNEAVSTLFSPETSPASNGNGEPPTGEGESLPDPDPEEDRADSPDFPPGYAPGDAPGAE